MSEVRLNAKTACHIVRSDQAYAPLHTLELIFTSHFKQRFKITTVIYHSHFFCNMVLLVC